MPGRFSADVVFCLDASGWMKPCFDGLRKHLGAFVEGLCSGGQMGWDLRLDFLAHRANEEKGQGVHHFQSLRREGMDLVKAVYQPGGQGAAFFSTDLEEFKRGLGGLKAYGDEASFVAVDTCLDFPWRDAASCHRVLILLTDEALETGVCLREQQERIGLLIEKLHALRVKLFLVGPESASFDALCAADRSEYLVVQDGDGLVSLDFGKVLETMGKSVSVSLLQGSPSADTKLRGLFGQASWRAQTANFRES